MLPNQQVIPSTPTSSDESEPQMRIIKVCDLLGDPQLKIPSYQRPYKWTTKNVSQLISDICKHSDKSSYRLGTIVLHQEGDFKNIVDGQQRIVSLALTIRAIQANCLDRIKDEDLKLRLNKLHESLLNPEISSEIAQYNVQENYRVLNRLVSRPEFTEQNIEFLLDHCKVVSFTLNNVSEAFQFFDSQNARGKDLDPHDLLKAYHLREFVETDQALKLKTVETWEESNTKDLAHLFSNYLFRIRQWSRGDSARFFNKDEVGVFKGVNLESIQSYPYLQQLTIAHHWIDHFNNQHERKIDRNTKGFPFHLDQIIINGRRFFEMTSFYQVRVKEVTPETEWSMNAADESDSIDIAWRSNLTPNAERIIDTINTYEGKHRTGDRYVRTIFDSLLIAYYDKFGQDDLSLAIEKIFIWSYSLRLKRYAVQLASMDNHVLENNLFRKLNNSIKPSDFTHCQLDTIETLNSASNIGEIVTLFTEMHYYASN